MKPRLMQGTVGAAWNWSVAECKGEAVEYGYLMTVFTLSIGRRAILVIC
jgi:hypothetical protein